MLEGPHLDPSWTLLHVPLPLADFNLYPFAVIKQHKVNTPAFYSHSSKLSNLRVVVVTPQTCSQLI